MSVQESEFDQLVAGITVPCDYNNGDDHECDEPVQWYMRFHQCNQEILCESHATEFVAQVIFTLQKYGSVVCTDCAETFYRPSDFITLRKV